MDLDKLENKYRTLLLCNTDPVTVMVIRDALWLLEELRRVQKEVVEL